MKGISGAVVIRGNSNRMKENAQKKKKTESGTSVTGEND